MKASFAALFLLLVPGARALQIDLDYTYDQANGDFFGQHAVAKAALAKAAADISAVITSSLSGITADVFTSTVSGNTVTLNLSAGFTNPSTGADVTVDAPRLAANTVKIYVGMQSLAGSTLGEGGPGSFGFGISTSGGNTANLQTAMNQAVANATNQFGRQAGPVSVSLQGSLSNGVTYNLPSGAIFGNLWFDNDTNNDGAADNFSILDSYWHFDSSTNPLSSQNDFYSVALHELLHSIGFGTSETWNGLENGTTWNGAQAKQWHGGSGTNLVNGGHVFSSVQSVRLSDGLAQEAVMDPSLTQGTRKTLTQLDLAFLRDLGYTTVPEPMTSGLWATGVLLVCGRRARR